jgi:MFS family permease
MDTVRTATSAFDESQVQLGLKENWQQFTLLVMINAFVGGMVGLERSILPKIAEVEFHIAAKTAILSFIVVFGIVKAFTNFSAGALSNKLGRKNLLTLGWLFGIPVPFVLMFANNWGWIVAANVLLGINQGLAWSSTVIMKIDIVGQKQRGLATGLNESAGYIAVAIVAFFTGWIAAEHGLRPYPFYIGIGLSLFGFFFSWSLVKDTERHVAAETVSSKLPRLTNIFWETTWKNKNLGSVTQAGLINNLNDGMVWGLLPILLASKGLTIRQIGLVTAMYPAVWGIGQLFTGKMADIFCKRDLMFIGMLVQGMTLVALIFAGSITQFMILSIILGAGTALVYPTFLASVAENAHPADRASTLGVFRFWRDLGYAIGAVLTGVIADAFGVDASVVVIGVLTIFSSGVIFYRMKCSGHDFMRHFVIRAN